MRNIDGFGCLLVIAADAKDLKFHAAIFADDDGAIANMRVGSWSNFVDTFSSRKADSHCRSGNGAYQSRIARQG